MLEFQRGSIPLAPRRFLKGKKMKILHLYPGETYHAEGYVAGNRDGLIKLRDAIDRAITLGKGAAPVSINDGEGYTCFVLCVPNEEADNLIVPYTAEDAIVGSGKTDPDPETTIYPSGVSTTFCTWDELNELGKQAWAEDDS